MKKNLWYSGLFIACLAPLALRAQLQKGTIMTGTELAGVGLTVSNLSYASSSNTFLSLSPSIGFFVSDRFVAGGNLGFATTALDPNDAFMAIGATAYGRYYFNPKATNNHFYTGLLGGVAMAGSDDLYLLASVNTGMTRFLSPGTALDVDLAFTHNPSSVLGGSWGVGLSAGINMFLNPETRAGVRTAKAGFQRGSIMLGITANNVEFSFNEYSNTVIFAPSAGLFVTNRLVVGTNLLFNFIRFKPTTNISERLLTSTTAGISPYARYYFGQEKRILWYTGLSGGLSVNRFKDPRDLSENNSCGLSVNRFKDPQDVPANTNFGINGAAEGGINIFVSPNLALEVGAAAIYSRAFEVSQFNTQLKVGFNCFINRQVRND
jgi:hypothetical protein